MKINNRIITIKDMKKTISLMALLIVCLTLQAQNKQEQIKQIREAYAQAKADIAENGKNGNPRMDMEIALNDGTEVSEDFIINDITEMTFYFKRIHLRGDTDLFDPRCYFIIENWSANGHTSYREMLFDPFTNRLLFSYMHVETHAGGIIESRFYYDENGQLIEQKYKEGDRETTSDGQSWSTAESDLAMAKKNLAIFDNLMSQKGVSTESYTQSQTAGVAEQMKQIREAYAEAKQKIANDKTSELPRNMLIEIHDQEDPEMPAQTDIKNYWFEPVGDGEQTRNGCYFISSTTELGDHHVYSEYLFNPKTSKLMFCFSQQTQNEGPALEWRYYFDEKGTCIQAKGSEGKYGPGFADKMAAAVYLKIFNLLANS
jgi:hypothetical protein